MSEIKAISRNSNLELYRIILMLLIIAHHYVDNSPLLEIIRENPSSKESIFLWLFGMWGETGINCFLMITGYFMCCQNITLRKFLKLFLEVLFYNVLIYCIFVLFGYRHFAQFAFSICHINWLEDILNICNLSRNSNRFKRFSTKEALREYIEQ